MSTSAPPQTYSARIDEFPPFPQQQLPEDVGLALQAVLDDAIDAGTFRGATVAVALAGVGHWSGASGQGERSGTPMQRRAVLEIASIAKTITAAGVMRLVEQGSVALDDNAAQHLPTGYGRLKADGIRVRDLLGMRSGLSDPPNFDNILAAGGTGADVLDAASGRPAPADVEYANLNYLLLGELIAHVTGEPQHRALRKLLDEQGLDGMTFVPAYEGAKDDWDTRSDALSLAHWGYALYGRQVLQAASLDEMTSFHGQWYGLGTVDFSHPDAAVPAPAGIGHGGQGDATTMMVVFPERAIAVAVLGLGGELSNLGPLATALSEAALR